MRGSSVTTTWRGTLAPPRGLAYVLRRAAASGDIWTLSERPKSKVPLHTTHDFLFVYTHDTRYSSAMAAGLPFRDINVHSSPSHYAFSSPSSPSAPTLVVDRPNGDIRLHDGKLLGSKRVSSIAGILGMIKLRLG